MKITSQVLLAIIVLLLGTSALMASGQVGIYAIISRVVLEPNDKAPQRIQIWGAFTLVDGGTGSDGKTLTPQRGYLYFVLPSASGNANFRDIALKEWADFKVIAGTGQAVAFGRFGYIGVFSDGLISRGGVLMGGSSTDFNRPRSVNPVRRESVPPTSPDRFPLNMGLTKLSATGDQAAVVNQLQQALNR